jgi:hypothetical protein
MIKKYDETVLKAAYEYVRRQERATHPDGIFDGVGRWYPGEGEEQPCCDRIRRPSGRWPYSLMTHCRTLPHVAALYGVDPREVRRAVKDGAWKVIQAQEVLAK